MEPEELLNQVSAILREIFPTAAVFPRWALGLELGDCPAVLRESDGQGRINGWLMSITDFPRESASEDEDTTFIDGYTVRIWYVLQHDHGNDTTNSDKEFNANLKLAQNAFSSRPDLGLIGYDLRHDQLQFSEADIYAFGETRAHLAKGQLRVGVHYFLDDE